MVRTPRLPGVDGARRGASTLVRGPIRRGYGRLSQGNFWRGMSSPVEPRGKAESGQGDRDFINVWVLGGGGDEVVSREFGAGGLGCSQRFLVELRAFPGVVCEMPELAGGQFIRSRVGVSR